MAVFYQLKNIVFFYICDMGESKNTFHEQQKTS